MSKHDAELQKMKEYLEHCRRKLERCVKDKPVILSTLHKLSKVPVTPEVLEATGILKTLNALSNLQDEISERALNLYNKWKFILESHKKNKEISGKVLNHAPPTKVANQKPSDNYMPSRPLSVGNKSMPEQQKMTAIHQKEIFSSSVSKSQIFNDKCDVNRPCTSSAVCNNEVFINSANSNSLNKKVESHNLDKSEDYLSNPDLSISTDNLDDLSDSPTKNKIVEPYAIEMKEGMFKVVKMNPDDIPPYILRVRQLYDKALIKNNRELPSKRERDKDVSENDEIFKVKSPLKSDSSSPIIFKKSKKITHGSAMSKNSDKSDSPESDSNFHVEYENTSEKSSKGKGRNFETCGVNSNRLHPAKKDLSSDRTENEQKRIPEKKVKSKTPGFSKPVDKLKQHSPAMNKNIHAKSNSPNLTGFHILNAVESHQRTCDKMPSDRSVLSDEDALRFTTSKKERTSVYSGKRKMQDVPSLRRCCIQTLRKNLDSLRFPKKVPYDVIKPILQVCTPVQLRKVEENNHHLIKDTSELWKAHCQKDHRDKLPEQHESWKDMYWRVLEEQSRKLKNLAANISASKSHPERHAKLTDGNGTKHHPSPRQIKPTENRSVIIVDSPVIHRPSPKQARITACIENKTSVKPSLKKATPIVPVKKTVKKESDAPLMSKVKKFMGLTSKYKK